MFSPFLKGWWLHLLHPRPRSLFDFKIRKALQGWAIGRPQPRALLPPVTPRNLHPILAGVSNVYVWYYEVVLFHALFWLVFWGRLLFKISKLIIHSCNNIFGRAVQVYDLTWEAGCVHSTFRIFKKDQRARGQMVFWIGLLKVRSVNSIKHKAVFRQAIGGGGSSLGGLQRISRPTHLRLGQLLP